MLKKILFIFVIGFSISNSHGKEVSKEKLDIGIPKNWKIGFKNITKREYIIELIHESESIDNWTKMITIQKFPHPENYDLDSFMTTVKNGAKNKCSQLQVADVITSEQNGFKFIQKNFHCIKKSDNLKEIFSMKVIKGNKYLYVVQFAYRVDISDEEYMKWAYYIKDAVVKSID